MRVLLDHCVTRLLARALIGHEVRTAFEMGWADLRNGELLRAASGVFEVFVTVDRNLSQQQNLANLPLPVVVLVSRHNKLEALRPLVPSLLATLDRRLENRVYVIQQ